MIKVRTICLVILQFFCNNSYSQVEWGKSFGGENWDTNTGIDTDDNSNVYTIGTYRGEVNFNTEEEPILDSVELKSVYVQKRSPGGKHIWTNYFKSSSLAISSDLYVKGDYIYVFLRSRLNLTYTNRSENLIDSIDQNGEAMIVKLTLNGDFVWSKSFGDCFFGLEITDLVVNKNEDIYFTCNHSCPLDIDPGEDTVLVNIHPTNVPGPNVKSEALLAKFDSSGRFKWVTPITGEGDEFIYSLEIDAQNNLYISGRFNQDIDFKPDPSDSLILEYTESDDHIPFITKFNSFGEVLWAVKIDQMPSAYLSDITLTKGQEQLIFTGISGSSNTHIIAIKSNGSIQWQQELDQIRSSSVELDSENNIYLAGYFFGAADFDPSLGEYILEVANQESITDTDLFLLKLNPKGTFNNAVRFGCSEHDYFPYMAISIDNHLYVSGVFSGYTTHDSNFWDQHLSTNGSKDIYLFKVENDLHGDRLEQCNNLNIYPNPTMHTLFVHNSFSEAFDFKIYDHMGRLIENRKEEFNSAIIDVSHLKNGCYTIEVKSEKCTNNLIFCKI